MAHSCRATENPWRHRKLQQHPIPAAERKVPVVYYLSRHGRLQQPHFLELALAFPHALRLRDVIHRLNILRGKGFADCYSWSCKRSYKNGFVWCDLVPDDLIHPTSGMEYVLKGSELLRDSPPPVSVSTSISSCEEITKSAAADADLAHPRRSSSFEYMICRSESTVGTVDASTQTDDRRRHSKRDLVPALPPPSSSSEEARTLTAGDGKARASAALRNLITCGAVSAGAMAPHCCAERRQCVSARWGENWGFGDGVILTGGKGSDGSAELQRSSSHNADRFSKLELLEKSAKDEGRRIKAMSKKLRGFNLVGATLSGRRTHGSKRIQNVEVLHK